MNSNEWSHSRYDGEYFDGWYHGSGKYYYPNGVIYDGKFFKGQYHGQGTLLYPNGGKYKAEWSHGKMIKGDYYFHDDLKYEIDNWRYCDEDDRRFYPEHINYIQPAGGTQMTKEKEGCHEIPEGTYDVGEGYYEPIRSIIYQYNGEILRTPSESEVVNILQKCRYKPRVSLGKVSGENDIIIQKVKENNKHNNN